MDEESDTEMSDDGSLEDVPEPSNSPANVGTAAGRPASPSRADSQSEEVAKATVSQALGTMLFPITREVAQWEERKIAALKSRARLQRQEKLAKATAEDLRGIRQQVEADDTKLPVVERLYRAFEEAGDKQLEDEAIFSLWKSLISRIRAGDPDVDLVQEKLSSLTPGEAHLLLEIGHGKRIRNGIDPVVQAMSLGQSGRYYRGQRDQEMAVSLRSKGLVEQRPPIQRLVVAAVAFFMLWAASLAVGGSLFNSFGTMLVPVLVLGAVMAASLSVALFPPPVRPTWIGAKLVESANVLSDELDET